MSLKYIFDKSKTATHVIFSVSKKERLPLIKSLISIGRYSEGSIITPYNKQEYEWVEGVNIYTLEQIDKLVPKSKKKSFILFDNCIDILAKYDKYWDNMFNLYRDANIDVIISVPKASSFPLYLYRYTTYIYVCSTTDKGSYPIIGSLGIIPYKDVEDIHKFIYFNTLNASYIRICTSYASHFPSNCIPIL